MYPLAVELVEWVRREHFADERMTLAEVQVVQAHDELRLKGAVLDHHAAELFVSALRRHAPGLNWHDELMPLIAGPDYGWALVTQAVCDLRREPAMHSERISQAVFGEAIEVLRCHDDWVFVRLPDDYLGWMHAGPLWRCNATQVEAWRQHSTHLLTRPTLPCYGTAAGQPEHQLGLLPFGSLLKVEDEHGPFYQVRFPNQLVRWVPGAGLLSLKHRPPATLPGLHTVIGWLETMIGVPYLWGGRTPFGYDCSGVVQTVYGLLGIRLPRDADQQALVGTAISFEAIQWGDLLFFDTGLRDGELNTIPERCITHVGLALHDSEFLHASFSHGGLVRGSFDDHSPWFLPSYRHRFITARRLLA
ncbi:MAG: C40 family peptidase [Herpetosiphonaceae bacterium]|nr:C40 family peptidase [Herpetosiphonaceae bacterium]